jgi:hypothetical protein
MISSWLGASAVGWLAPVVPLVGARPLSVMPVMSAAGLLAGVVVSGMLARWCREERDGSP